VKRAIGNQVRKGRVNPAADRGAGGAERVIVRNRREAAKSPGEAAKGESGKEDLKGGGKRAQCWSEKRMVSVQGEKTFSGKGARKLKLA